MNRILRSKESRRLEKLLRGTKPEVLDRIVDKAAFQTLALLVKASPKKWFGQIRSGWKVRNTGPAKRKIEIDPEKMSAGGTSVAAIAKFVDQGTANNGQGFIFPKRAKRLYIPLRRRAIIWRQGFKYGTDYVLARKVRGIKGRRFVRPVRFESRKILTGLILAHVRKLAGLKDGQI